MTADRPAETVLSSRASELARVGVVEIPDLGQVDVRCPTDSARTLGFPQEPDTVAVGSLGEVLWLGPDEWLVVCDAGAVPPTLHRLADALAATHASIVDVGASRVVLQMTGTDRHEVLAGACTIDLDGPSWRTGACAQTLFGRCPVILQEGTETTRIFARRSFAGYVADLLLEVSV